MLPIVTRHTNEYLNPPESWDDKAYGPCDRLPVYRAGGMICSYWTTSLWERLAILFGRPIRLVVTSIIHPPVSLDTEIV